MRARAAQQRRPGACRMLPLFAGLICLAQPARGAVLEICRSFDIAAPARHQLAVPAGSVFRDDGRADDPLAPFGGDRWPLRLETLADVAIPPLAQCTRALVRATGDSAIKSVSIADNRGFVYAGSSNLLNPPVPTEELLSLKGRVLDQVP